MEKTGELLGQGVVEHSLPTDVGVKDITAVHLGQDEAFAEDPLGFFPVGAAVALDHHVDVEEIHGGILRVDEEAGALIHPDHDGDEITVWVDGVGRKLFPFGCGELLWRI